MNEMGMDAKTVEIDLKESNNADGQSYANKKEMIADIRRQVIEMFYGNLRGFFSVMNENFNRMQPDHPMVKAVKTVIEADEAGKLEDHIAFDGQSVTHMSKDGNTVMVMFADFQEMLNKAQDNDGEKDSQEA